MSDDRLKRVERLFEQALELPESERAAFIHAQCGDDEKLRDEVDSLLGHHSDVFLETPAHMLEEPPPAETAPERIGPYRILETLGSGGMGVVYLAEQETPVRRRVALKLIKLGMDTQSVVSRFEGERQALALMNHPNIAQVYDAGATDSGRPYFVMEHVEGVPLTTHCDRQRLSTDERLRLFLQVCDGVQHAHQKGIIHRDLKASNVLVAVRDGKPVPKIIDFGIAKATDQRQAAATALTEQGWVVGTPEYMSPEQTVIGGEDIDTRTDVYSLGVLLYELLAGLPPFDPQELRRASFDELCRRIREEEPPRPSSRIRAAGELAQELAAARRIDSQLMVRKLRGDLDWIVMKALEKDRERRYSTAAEMSADIGRHLEHEPVQARPPGTAYRVGKFVRRHRFGVAAACVVLVALLAGIVGTTTGMVRARRAEAAAVAVEEFLVGSFELPDPDKSMGQTVTAREILDAGAERIREEFEGRPQVQGRLMGVMGRAYRGLGLYDSALPLLIEALEVKREALGPRSPEVLDALNEIGNALTKSDRFEEALPYYEEALEIAEQILDPTDTRLATILKNVGVAYEKVDRFDPAFTYQMRALEMRRAALGEDNIVVAKSLSSLGHLLARSGKPEQAIPLHEESLEIRRRVLDSPHAPQLGFGHYYLAQTLFESNRYDEAIDHLGKALEIWETSLGDKHERVGACLFRLAEMHEAAGDLEDADLRYQEALEFDSRIYPGLDPRVLDALDGYAAFLRRAGRDAEAAELEKRAQSIRDHAAAGKSDPS